MAISTNALLGLAVVAIVLAGGAVATTLIPKAPTINPIDRTIYMSAIEPKGSASNSSEPFPSTSLPLGGGYALKAPDATGKWEVETYIWEPSLIVVYQGDKVTLKILGVNGKEHTSSIAGYVDNFTVKRGQLTTLTFTADKVGTFSITCTTHQPSMTAYLVVLPRT